MPLRLHVLRSLSSSALLAGSRLASPSRAEARADDTSQNMRCWTWSLELARSYSDINPSTHVDAQSVFITEIWSSETFVSVTPEKTFPYSAGHTGTPQRWSRCLLLTFDHLRPLSSAVAIWARPIQALISGARCNAQGCSGVEACLQPKGTKKRAPL